MIGYGVVLASVLGLAADSVTVQVSQHRNVNGVLTRVFQGTLKGKTIELQRSTAGGWVRIRRARLAHKPCLRWGPFNYKARFRIPNRGLRLRAYLPQASAAPATCPAVPRPSAPRGSA